MAPLWRWFAIRRGVYCRYRELYIKARLFQQGAEEFEGQPLEALTKYLLKSFGASMLNMLCQIRVSRVACFTLVSQRPSPRSSLTEITARVCSLQAAEDFVDAEFPANMTQEQRAKVLKRFPAGAQTELTTLNTLLSEKVGTSRVAFRPIVHIRSPQQDDPPPRP